jgi:hypothetical protein
VAGIDLGHGEYLGGERDSAETRRAHRQ